MSLRNGFIVLAVVFMVSVTGQRKCLFKFSILRLNELNNIDFVSIMPIG